MNDVETEKKMKPELRPVFKHMRLLGNMRRLAFAASGLPVYVFIVVNLGRAFDWRMGYSGVALGGVAWGALFYLMATPFFRRRNREWSRAFDAEGGIVCFCNGKGCGYEKCATGVIVICTQEGRVIRAVEK
jgi:hypothetical protein